MIPPLHHGPLLLAAAADKVPGVTQQAVGYPTLFVLVMLGALVPVIPTGVLVSSSAVVAFHQSFPFPLLMVFASAALAAFLGDVALYWLGRRGMRSEHGSRWLNALRDRAPADRLEQARHKLDDNNVMVLVLSRLVPGGRIPVMLACLLAQMPMRTFVRGNLPACVAWAVTYQLIGILGGSLFPEPWQGVVAAIALTLLISGGPSLWRRLRRRGSETGEARA
ncbi:DedA family protein [Streptomyces sp. NPDC007088]|uniref:DedA family protein n=1 Tax=Streptomyces sp. NPDC007088 TaxID=3364773 RepID=UPI00367415AB